MIVTLGEILVEIMADRIGAGFREPLALSGPYPSGAPAIYISQVARMGAACGIISAVGSDDFGWINLDRLSRDGVDVSAVTVDPDRPTGSAFVRYRADGTRDFVFNIAHSACASIAIGPAAEVLLARARHLHVVGSSLASQHMQDLALQAARRVKAQGGTVSFDPNLRKEMQHQSGLMQTVQALMALADLFLPSGDEVFIGVDTRDLDQAVAVHLARGIRAVVHKRGDQGASCFDQSGQVHQRAFAVCEVDPTGAGDCFAGAFTVLWHESAPMARPLAVAAAAGALAVAKRGPMEGAGLRADLEVMIG